MTEMKKVDYSDLPDHIIEHLEELENKLITAICPIVEHQRLDLAIGALLTVTSFLFVSASKNNMEFIEENKDHFIKCFANNLDCDIENQKMLKQQDQS